MNWRATIPIQTAVAVAGLLVLAGCSETSPNETNSATPASGASASASAPTPASAAALGYAIVDTNQAECYDAEVAIGCPEPGNAWYGQDGQYDGNQPQYVDNGDGTVTDQVTGLMWQAESGEKVTYQSAVSGADGVRLGGYDDWRLPTIRELYSLMDFQGIDPDPRARSTDSLRPFLDEGFFGFSYGDASSGGRLIDAQWATATRYESTVMGGQECFFGVNFADGRIKCYPTRSGQNQGYYVRYVRGDSYGENEWQADGQTVADRATGLTWQRDDSGEGLTWQDALAYCEDSTVGGSDDWRLPNAKELHSLVDYTVAPDIDDAPAVDPLFTTSRITNEAGQDDWPFFWTSTTHRGQQGAPAAYVAFGRAMGNMDQFGGWIDVHGAGAQRSDPKAGDPADYADGRGPQGDAVRILNHARCVRDSP